MSVANSVSSERNVLRIRTSEGIFFSLPLAGPVVRGLALVIDLCVISALSGIAARLLPLLDIIELGLAKAVGIVLYLALSVGYGIVCEWLWRGQTLGKRLLRLQVIDERGLPLAFSQVALRNILRAVDMLPAFYLVGAVSCFATRHYRRLGDLAARTVVIRHAKTALPDVDQILPGKFNSFLAHPHLVARLRQAVPPAEASLVLQALLRRNEFDPEARVRLFAAMAARFRALVPFPEEAVRELADEQYVRNVAHVLFHVKRPSPVRARPPSPPVPPAPSL